MSTLPLTYKYFLGGAAAGGFFAYSYQKSAQKTLVAQLRDEYDEKFSDVSKAAYNKAKQTVGAANDATVHAKDYTKGSIKSSYNNAKDSIKSTLDDSKNTIDDKAQNLKTSMEDLTDKGNNKVETKYHPELKEHTPPFRSAKKMDSNSDDSKSSWLSWSVSNKEDPELRKQEMERRLKHSLTGFGENAQFFAEDQFAEASDILQKTKDKYYQAKSNTEELINDQLEKAKNDFDSAKKELDSFTTHWYQFGKKVDESAKKNAQQHYEYAENVYNNAKYELDHFKNAVYKSADTFKNEYKH